MPRPKKVKTEQPTVLAEEITAATPVVEETIVVPTEQTVEETPAFPAEAGAKEPAITPEFDAREMDRYFRVINNSEAASRIAPQITHQRELQLWGVHQYDNASRNTFARSFYFKELRNAQHALEAAQKLV